MALFGTTIFIIFAFLLLSLQPSTSVGICRVSCGNQWIRFPFRLNNQPDRCGYPRFNLSCRNQTKTILALPFSGEFIVENIDYWSQTIWIDDPDYCTPRRLLKGLNSSGTPFEPLYPQNYMFLNCSIGAPTQLPEARHIYCLSGKTFSVVAIPTNRLDMYQSLLSSCLKIATVSVPASDPNYAIRLTWNEPDCMSCENRAGSCLFKGDTGLDIGCLGGFSTGLTKSAKYGIMFGVGIPLLCILGLVFYLRKKANNYNHHQHPDLEISIISVAPLRLAADAKGLDGPTIEAYPITLVGESRRLPRPNDNTCPICLCEYQAKETLRTIPDCKHYFHASCIDEWLKLNATCPLCRNFTNGSAPTASSSSSSQINMIN
ncbi:hypothetical protein CRYUN_Cryun12cG0058000 [Craigia yunnanensis]